MTQISILAEDEQQRAAAREMITRDETARGDYRDWRKKLDAVAEAIRQRCLDCFEHRAKLSGLDVKARVKEWDKLRPKLQDGRAESWDACPDLIGVKIIVLSTEDVAIAEAAVESMLRPGIVQELRWYATGPSAKGYHARHMVLEIPDDLDVPEPLRRNGAELQIVTALQDAWGTFSHDDFYKAQDGVPYDLSKRVLRLAAVMNLVDEEIQSLRASLAASVKQSMEAVQLYTRAAPPLIDAVTLRFAAGTVLRPKFLTLRELGRDAGFRVSGWAELIRQGFETDEFLLFAQQVGIKTLADFEDWCDRAEQWRGELEALARTLDSQLGYIPIFDRPLSVLEAVLTFEYPHTASPLTDTVKDAIAQVRNGNGR